MSGFSPNRQRGSADLLPGDAARAEPSFLPRPEGEGSATFFPLPVRLCDEALMLLAVVAAHDRVSPADFLTRAICARAGSTPDPSETESLS
ncbi:hypothetical protein [Chelativorans oligotrophicus]|uniref:hypothetical protein n=1 Tax=Chelativorans oligotrophicus TaxID=449974 RepID=UPI0014097290|nr:hypothetical protein [Chelativorans oligotrophicus]